MVCILRTIPPKLIHMPTQSGVILPAFLCTIHWISSLALSNELRVYCTSTNNYFWLLHRSIFLLPSLGYLTSGIGRNSESSLVSHPNTHSLSLPIVLSLSLALSLSFSIYLTYSTVSIYDPITQSIYLFPNDIARNDPVAQNIASERIMISPTKYLGLNAVPNYGCC